MREREKGIKRGKNKIGAGRRQMEWGEIYEGLDGKERDKEIEGAKKIGRELA